MRINIKNKLVMILLVSTLSSGSAWAGFFGEAAVATREAEAVAGKEVAAGARSVLMAEQAARAAEAAAAAQAERIAAIEAKRKVSASLAEAISKRGSEGSVARALEGEPGAAAVAEPGAAAVAEPGAAAAQAGKEAAEQSGNKAFNDLVAGAQKVGKAVEEPAKTIQKVAVAAGALATAIGGAVELIKKEKSSDENSATPEENEPLNITEQTGAANAQSIADKANEAVKIAKEALAKANELADQAKQTVANLTNKTAQAKTEIQYAAAIEDAAEARLQIANLQLEMINTRKNSAAKTKDLAKAKRIVELEKDVVIAAHGLSKAYTALDKAKNAKPKASKQTLDKLAAAAIKAEEAYKKAFNTSKNF